MLIDFGTDAGTQRSGENKRVLWDSTRVINGHLLIVGKSGTGKTFTLKKILDQLNAQGDKGRFRVHIMDVHGDMEIDGASSVKFSEATNYGLNPLSVNPDPDFGGVRKRIQSFLAALNRTSRQLGSKQEAVLRNILYDLYSANGFYDGKPNSWRLDDGVERKFPKRHPTIEDAMKFANYKLKSMFLGTSSLCVSNLENLNKKATQIYKKQKNINKATSPVEREELTAELKRMGDEAVGLFQSYIDSIQTGMEMNDIMKYDSKDVMKSVVEKLENLNAIGIFRPNAPPFDRHNPIWRYDIKALATDEKKLFVSFLLEAIFLRSVQRGVQKDLVEVIVLDEAHLFLDDDPDNIVNTIAKEARKFGLGIFCASQSPTHFSDDFLSNVGTKIILGIDQMYWDGTVRKLKCEMQALEWIVPHQKLIMQINNRAETKNKFTWVALR